jgi:hypothetical protein
MQKHNEEGYIVLFEAPKTQLPEFRLYYDDAGKVVCYSCEKLEGSFIVIDANTFAQARPDVRVIDGEITQAKPAAIVSKLMPGDTGQACAKQDISIVVDKKFEGDITNWKMVTYEL